MALSSTPVLLQTPKLGLTQIANADASNQKTLVTAGANGAKVVAVFASSTDTAARDIELAVVRSATTYGLATSTVAASSGTSAAAPSVNLLNSAALPTGAMPVDQDGQPYLFLENGDTLVALALSTVTSGKTISVLAVYSNF